MTEVLPPPGLQKTMGIAAIRPSISRVSNRMLGGKDNYLADQDIPEADRPVVVYIDNDPVCVAHVRALLATNEQSHYLLGDPTDPNLLHDPAVSTYLDLECPVGVLLCGVLHHVDENLDPAGIVHGWIEVLPPGSFLVLTLLRPWTQRLPARIRGVVPGTVSGSTRVRLVPHP
jgi:hypothetical protein